MDSVTDTRMMASALQLARRGQYSAMPNPHVGCVLVRDGQVIGEGFTQPAGGNHAEIEALEAAGDARGAVAYVTLEPCSHQGKTGPCAQALINAGVTRVVAAMPDPNPEVAGRGLEHLRAAGIAVDCGLLEREARQLIPGFVARMTRGHGRVRAKLAMSLDGRTAMASGESQWITGADARRDVQRLRAASCAIVTGVGTVLADDTPPAARVLADGGPALLCHRSGTLPSRELAAGRAELFALPGDDNGLDLHALMAELGTRQCNEILVESGPRLAGALLQAGLLDELIVYMAPTLMGDLARPLLSLPLQHMAEKVPLRIEDVRKIGEDWRFTARPA
jgi:diaminohydroxyphosphoribosylaminopyrimidine deaminase/5-amino-6-(5-phosphoribosylamino)uracil reductase